MEHSFTVLNVRLDGAEKTVMRTVEKKELQMRIKWKDCYLRCNSRRP